MTGYKGIKQVEGMTNAKKLKYHALEKLREFTETHKIKKMIFD